MAAFFDFNLYYLIYVHERANIGKGKYCFGSFAL